MSDSYHCRLALLQGCIPVINVVVSECFWRSNTVFGIVVIYPLFAVLQRVGSAMCLNLLQWSDNENWGRESRVSRDCEDQHGQ